MKLEENKGMVNTTTASTTPTRSPTGSSMPSATPSPTRTSTQSNTPTITPTRYGPVIDFDSFPNNHIVDQDYLDLGVRFHSTARVVSSTGAPSAPNMVRSEAGADIEITFHVPRTLDPAVTNFVGFKKPSGILPGMIAEVFDSENHSLDQATATTIGLESFGFHVEGIARLVLSPPGGGIQVGMDDLEFNTPIAPFNLDQNGDGEIDAKDLLLLLTSIKTKSAPNKSLFLISQEW